MGHSSGGADLFPRQTARTRRFTLGRPRTFSVAPGGSRVVFLRSRGGGDVLTCLWALDLDTGQERLVADPRSLGGSGDADLPDAERARRERAREAAEGIVDYAADRDLRMAAFSVGGGLCVADLSSGDVREVPAKAPVFDPRPDPGGRKVAYVSGRQLRVVALSLQGDLESGEDRALAAEDDPDVSWGAAEFVAAEEMDRLRGYWWAPDGSAVIAARVDTGSVLRWYIGDPANPATPPASTPYPAAGTLNAVVTLHVLGLDGSRVDVAWDNEAFPYLVGVTWGDHGPPCALVQSRDQRQWVVLAIDPAAGETRPVWEDRDEAWLEIVPGVPAWTDDGRLVMAGDRAGARRVLVDGRPLTPATLHVRGVLHAGADVIFTAHEDEPMETHVWRASLEGELSRLSDGPGVHSGTAGSDVLVLESASMDFDGVRAAVWREGREVAVVASLAERPVLQPNVSFLKAGRSEIRTAVLLPSDARGEGLPVLLDPYGYPQFQRVVLSRNAHLESQWFAEHGFAVVVADGRGTPGRGTAWEQAVKFDLATPVLEDQVEALHRAAEQHPEFDLSRVAIRGWSGGGYLAALAVLRRPDVFHAAIAGAPVTDLRLYDTHYMERYLGHPDEHPEAYEHSSLMADAGRLKRPLLLIHGLADDNVVVAHTLRLSRALLEAGRPHRTLLLAGVTHMTPAVEEHLLLLQLDFLRDALGLSPEAPA